MDNKKLNFKRKISATLVAFLFIAYFLVIDPDTKIFQDLPFGSSLILTLSIFVISIGSIIIIEFLPDYFIDEIYGSERELRKKAENEPVGASNVLIAKSIRMLGYSFIISASIIAYNFG